MLQFRQRMLSDFLSISLHLEIYIQYVDSIANIQQ